MRRPRGRMAILQHVCAGRSISIRFWRGGWKNAPQASPWTSLTFLSPSLSTAASVLNSLFVMKFAGLLCFVVWLCYWFWILIVALDHRHSLKWRPPIRLHLSSSPSSTPFQRFSGFNYLFLNPGHHNCEASPHSISPGFPNPGSVRLPTFRRVCSPWFRQRHLRGLPSL